MKLHPNIDTNTIDIIMSEDEMISRKMISRNQDDGSVVIKLTPRDARSWIKAISTGMDIMASQPPRCVCGKCGDYTPGTPTVDTMSVTELLTFLSQLPSDAVDAALSVAIVESALPSQAIDVTGLGDAATARADADYRGGYPSAPSVEVEPNND